MPIVTQTAPASGSFAQLQVKYHTGYHPSNPTVCGQTPSMTSPPGIDVFQYANSPNGTQINCLDHVQHIIAHEVGHHLGLDHVGDCNSIMSGISGTPRYVTSTDCQVAKDNLSTYGEQNYLYSPGCSEPCFGPCNSFGNCPAEDANSPIIVSLKGQHFVLSGLDDRVLFDLDADGVREPTGWTGRGDAAAFLVYDVNQNGFIDNGTELFGDSMLIPGTLIKATNGFEVLRAYDQTQHGGNYDATITDDDLVFGRLRLWVDVDHDGLSDAGELRTLSAEGIISIDLDYEIDYRADRHGNIFAYGGRATRRETPVAAPHQIQIWDVYLVGEDKR